VEFDELGTTTLGHGLVWVSMGEAPPQRVVREETWMPEGEPCPYCAHLAPNPEELRLHLLHLHPEAEPEPDWWDRDAVPPPLL
jgi:hypothetical protein